VKKMILAMAAVAALVPASSAMAASSGELQLSGPSVTIVNLLTGGTSGGGPITFAGQQIDGIQAQGAARYRERDTDGDGKIDENELKVTANDVNADPNADVLSILFDRGGPGFVANNSLQGNQYKLEGKGKAADNTLLPDLSSCGSFVVAIPLPPLSDIVLASLTQGGDPAELFAPKPVGCA
jgi:hypothetical protein